MTDAMTKSMIRFVAFLGGSYVLFVQVQLLREQFQGASGTVLLAIPAISIALALSLGVVDWARRRSKWHLVIGGLLAFVLLSAVSLTGTLGRVSDIRANRSARAEHILELRASTTKAETTAQAAVDEATKQIIETCKSGVGPICKLWTESLKTARGDLATAKDKIATLPQADNSEADMQRISEMTGLSIDVVERWVPVLFPVGLEVIVILAFMIAMGDLSDPVREYLPTITMPPPPNPEPVAGENDIMSAFLKHADIDGVAVGELFQIFERWSDTNGYDRMTLPRFSKLLDGSGLTKRRVNGRIRVYR